MIRACWENSTTAVPDRLINLGEDQSLWFKAKKHGSRAKKLRMKECLPELSVLDPDDAILAELIEVKLGLNLEADKEELFWEQ
ncbi:hypothetical protein V6N13_141611 [Hibiscus sabdariffa]